MGRPQAALCRWSLEAYRHLRPVHEFGRARKESKLGGPAQLLGYLAQPVYRRAQGTLAVVQGASEPVVKRLREIRARSETVAALHAARPVALLDLSRPHSPPEAATSDGTGSAGLIGPLAVPLHARALRPPAPTDTPFSGWFFVLPVAPVERRWPSLFWARHDVRNSLPRNAFLSAP